ncbi:MAG: spore germination protein [Ruminococcaceae bacterium]|nr:spore germination protein [Oscillospiraceae bacterium]
MSARKIDSCFSYIRKSFENCADFNARNLSFSDGKIAYLLNIGSYTDRDYISETIILPLLKFGRAPADRQELFGIISSSEFSLTPDADTAITQLLSGFAILLCENTVGDFYIFSSQVKMVASRSVSEPSGELVIRGPREGFVESSEDNLALLRKRLKTANFKAERLVCGSIYGTTVYICYIENIANADTVSRVKNKIENMPLPAIINSGYIEHYLQKSPSSLFTNAGSSEKPDVVSAKLLEGRVAVICDGSPSVLTVPYLFIEALQSPEDYLKTEYYATFMRCLRFLGAIIALYLPAIYLSTVEHHSSVLPYKIYKAFITLRQDVPFDVFGEFIVILLIFELIREVSIRMPKAVGSAVSIVAGLTLGDAAISANLASAPVIMASALSAMCTFIVPPLMNSIVLLRFVNLLLADFLGFPGVILSACFILANLSRTESFGVPCLLPFAPIRIKGLKDSLFVKPLSAINSPQSSLYPKGDD